MRLKAITILYFFFPLLKKKDIIFFRGKKKKYQRVVVAPQEIRSKHNSQIAGLHHVMLRMFRYS